TMTRQPRKQKLLPYTTLFRSYKHVRDLSDINKQMSELNAKGGVLSQTHDEDSEEMQELINEMMELRELQFDVQKTYIKNNSNSIDRKSTRLNSSHVSISYVVF